MHAGARRGSHGERTSKLGVLFNRFAVRVWGGRLCWMSRAGSKLIYFFFSDLRTSCQSGTLRKPSSPKKMRDAWRTQNENHVHRPSFYNCESAIFLTQAKVLFHLRSVQSHHSVCFRSLTQICSSSFCQQSTLSMLSSFTLLPEYFANIVFVNPAPKKNEGRLAYPKHELRISSQFQFF